MTANQDEKTIEELLDVRSATNMALDSKLADALENLAEMYVSVYGPKNGIEKMCDGLFERAAVEHHPGGWAGLLQYAKFRAG